MEDLPRVSVVVATRDRPRDLSDLLLTILDQKCLPLEVIIVDDSLFSSAKQIADSIGPRFRSCKCQLKYIEGSGNGLPNARNLGVRASEGDAILFLDDDTLLDQNVVGSLATFFRNNPLAFGIQPEILPLASGDRGSSLARKLENAIYKVLLQTYNEEDRFAVRRSGTSVSPSSLTKIVRAQRLSGCCCYRRKVFDKSRFDTNLKRYGYKEDLDFSYRVYKRYPQSLYVIPESRITHKMSENARMPTKLGVHMTTIYWFYVFFKDVYEDSVLNLVAFLWALAGRLMTVVGWLIIRRKSRCDWWALAYLLGSYATALRNLKNIRMARLEFFNKNL